MLARLGLRGRPAGDRRGPRPALPGAAAQPQPTAGGPVRATAFARAARRTRRSAGLATPDALHGLHRALGDARACATRRAPPSAAHALASAAARDPAWADWVERWHATSTLTPKVRAIFRDPAGQGRALAGRRASRDHRAGPVDPADLRGLGRRRRPDGRRRLHPAHATACAGRVGEPLIARAPRPAYLAGRPRRSSATARNGSGSPRRFDPAHGAGHAAQHRARCRPRPARDRRRRLGQAAVGRAATWSPTTCPTRGGRRYYPLELHPRDHPDLAVRRAAQRRDRPAAGRLHPLATRRASPIARRHRPRSLAQDAVCLLDVPTHKTGTAFTKPVDPPGGPGHRGLAGASGPTSPQVLDRKTSERVRLAVRLSARTRIAQALHQQPRHPRRSARKAGVPTADVRGNITSHRARSTIASQLYNAKEPMTLFELQAWLGHRSPASDPALRQDHPEHAGQGLQRRRLLRPQRPHHRGPRRPRRRHLRCRRRGRAVAALRPRPRLVHLHLLRAVPAPNGLRPLRFLHPEGLQQGPTAGGQGQPAADARQPSRSPTTNKPPSTTGRPPSTSSSND